MSYVVKILKPVIVFLFLTMTLITFAATLARLFPSLPSFYWAGEATRYLNFWITCLGIGVALHMGTHFSLTIVVDMLPAPLRRAAAIISHVGVLVLAAVLIQFGIQMMTWNFDQLSAAMEIPMSYVYAGIPVCGALVFAQTAVSLVRIVLGKDEGPAAEGMAP
ncbi:TRAP transporter small permease [Microbaculum marinisediminis]|uniref:TRAP transporter small permease protein n=1 Tax=Microbaculum marinisediminis TaxID=2931392 RepID=A0AAW5QXX1_9HYPH|nr:TRAP transporter small permease [Microbaculum sp. A6E488]MCT8971830.1 TRAP transporter small permease [Microbaculum sp. A6E488]